MLPADLILARFEGDVSVEELLAGEANDITDVVQTRARGEKFFNEQKACVLRVPSVVLPEEYNYVLNPLHRDAAKICLVESRHFAFDGRLL